MHYRRFSIVTTCHNRWYHLQRTWRTWAQQDYPNVELIIVAAGPDESPVELVNDETFSGSIVRVRNAPYHRGSRYRNIGALAATGEYLGFVDCDVALHPQWVTSCVTALRRYELVLNERTARGDDAGSGSGTLAVARWVHEKIHGYNENLDFAWGYEDTDYMIRAQRAGARVGGYPLPLIRHISHDDDARQRNYLEPHEKARLPRLFLRHMRVCDQDDAVHSFEANRTVRLQFPVEQVTQVRT